MPIADEPSIGYLSDYSGTPYWLYGPGYTRRVAYLRGETFDALLAAMKEHRVTVVYFGVLGASKRAMMDDSKNQLRLAQEGIRVLR